MNIILQFLSNANKISSCGDYKAPSVVFEIEEYKKLLSDIKKRGIKVRYVTDITKDNVKYCRDLVEFFASAIMAEGQTKEPIIPIQQVIYSNVRDIVEQQRYVFESFWNKAIPAERRIREIEEGIASASTEVIQIPSRTKELFIDLIKSVKHEVLLLFPTVNSFLREERIGIIQLLKEAASIGRKVKVRVISPTNNTIEKILQNMQIHQPNNFLDIQRVEETTTTSETNVNTVTILVVDRRASLVIEKVDDSKLDFIDAIGSATYSTSKPTVLSYISIFENLSNQVKLYEKLKTHDKMQKEFINVASHEMKTPTQAIIGYSALVQKHPEKRDEMLHAISRNAERLRKLTNDILDVTRIEGQTLSLNKEVINLNDLVMGLIEDFESQIQTEHSKVQILYNGLKSSNGPFLIEADRGRISQCISNLLGNAIKFSANENSDGGTVSITIRKEEKNENSDNHNIRRVQGEQVRVSISDNGEGIHPEILPRLFTKFASKSEMGGTGLGLYITKSIIEAHSGRIWAENNKYGKGATFSFIIPLHKKQHQQPTISGTRVGHKQ